MPPTVMRQVSVVILVLHQFEDPRSLGFKAVLGRVLSDPRELGRLRVEKRLFEHSLDRPVQIARLGAVALVHEYVDVALGAEAQRQLLDRLDECLRAFVALLLTVALAAELVDQRAKQ
jgi:hypothetical protein